VLGEVGDLVTPIRALGVPVDCLGMRAGIPNPAKLLELIAKLRASRPDVISTWLYHADLLGGLAGRALGIPVVWGIRSSAMPAAKTKLSMRALIRTCAVLAPWLPTAIACCSNAALESHARIGYPRRRFTVVPNGFELDRFRPDAQARRSVRAELGLDPDHQLVGMIARFDPHKNHQGFVEAATHLLASHPGLHFVLVGDRVDSANQQLAEWLARTGAPQRFHLLGLRRDVPRLIAALDVAVSSSWTEAFPNVVGEAMACGVPCVVTDVGDSADIVGDCGVTVASGNPAALAAGVAALVDLAPTERTALGARARQRVAERFEIGSTAGKFEVLFREVAGK
jgi:glycosyltransferase involved in cell wall biosynthesis